MIQRLALLTALAAILALAGCGGGSDSTPPAPPPPPSPPPVSIDRIEPLDTATRKRVASSTAPAASLLPAGAVVPQVVLGPWVPAKAALVSGKDRPLQIGWARPVNATAAIADLTSRLRWARLPDGSQVAALAFSSAGAQALRLGLQVLQLPPGAVLRFYGAPGTAVTAWSAEQLAAWQRANMQGGQSPEAARTVWGPDTPGALATLELQLPPGATPADLQLAVPQLSHLTQTVEQAVKALDPNIGDAGACTLDVMCSPQLDTESRAVARILFTDAGSSYLCSGTLLNDTRGSLTGYANCDSTTCIGATVDSGAMWQIGWTQGTTEEGSSGSAIWALLGSTRYVVGALHGGSASCQNPQGADFFGRFDRAFYRGLGTWLTP